MQSLPQARSAFARVLPPLPSQRSVEWLPSCWCGDDAHGVVRISSGSPSYDEIARLMERVSGQPVKRTVREQADIDAAVGRGDYPALFAANIGTQHPGMAWEQSTAWNTQHGFKVQSWEEFAEGAIRQQSKQQQSGK